MNNKISLPDLVELLAQKLDCTKKDAEAFLKEFFQLAAENVSAGESLKINGLGVFKLTWVEKRSSVNVQTGEPFEIPGHYKLSFTPDKEMREAVNAPFAVFNVEILDDNVNIPDTEEIAETEMENEEETEEEFVEIAETTEVYAGTKESLQPVPAEPAIIEKEADASQDIPVLQPQEAQKESTESLSEKISMVQPEEITNEPEAAKTEEEALPNTSELEIEDEREGDMSQAIRAQEESAVQPVDDETISDNRHTVVPPPYIVTPPPIPQIVPAASKVSGGEEDSSSDPRFELETLRTKNSLWRTTAVCLLVVLCGVIVYLFLDSTGKIPDKYSFGQMYAHLNTEMTEDANKTNTLIVDTIQNQAPDTVSEEVSQEEIEAIPTPKEPEIEVKPKETTEVIRNGLFLTTLAKKHFGHKAFWVYIYKENSDVIADPNNVPVGTVVRIPDKSKYNIDASNSQSVDEAKALADTILNKKKK